MIRYSIAVGTMVFTAGLFSTGCAFAETCSECQRKVQTLVAVCVSKIPAEVKPKDPAKPTEAEKKAASERAAKSALCGPLATKGLTDCKLTAGCPQ